MSELVRFGISMDEGLLDRFDGLIHLQGYSNRSEAIRDLIREGLVKSEWVKGEVVAGIITLVYDHHQRELINRLTNIQHDFHQIILSSQHIHLDPDNCLEVVIARGNPLKIEDLAFRLKSTRGVKYGYLTMATTGKDLV